MEGLSLVLEKDDGEDFCSDQEERSSDIMSYCPIYVINCVFLVNDVIMQMLR